MQGRFFRTLLMCCLSIGAVQVANAQHASRIYVEPDGWSIGTNVGLSDLWGDVGTKSPLFHYANSKYFDKVAFVGGIFGKYNVHPCFAFKFMTNFGSLYTTDRFNYDLAKKATTQGEDAYQRYARAQNARTYVFEGAITMEFVPFRSNPESKMAYKRGQPYIAGGLGFFHYQPYSTVGASPRYVPIYNLKLEGQGFGDDFPPDYKLWSLCLPLSIGYRWDMGQHLNLGLEFTYRMTFTDYLDGVSGEYIDPAEYAKHLEPKDAAMAAQVADKGYYLGLQQKNAPGNLRGNPSNNDGYSTISMVFYYKLLKRTPQWWKPR